MIKSIIFDLGNVIVKVDRGNLYKEWAKNSGKSVNDILDCYSSSQARRDFEKGKLNSHQFYRKISDEFCLKMKFEDFKGSYCDIFSLNKNVADEIRRLKKNYRLVLLSNTDKLHFEYIKNKFSILNVFDDYVLSYKSGIRKPNPLIFIEAVRKCKALPFNCMYFDDIPEFVMVARLLGVKAYVFRNSAKMLQDFSKNFINQ